MSANPFSSMMNGSGNQFGQGNMMSNQNVSTMSSSWRNGGDMSSRGLGGRGGNMQNPFF